MTAQPHYYIDCDPGIDDALALAYVLRAGAQLSAVGTVSGNVDVLRAAENARRLLGALGRLDIPVAAGASKPLAGDFWGGAPNFHGTNGTGEVGLSASDQPFDDLSAAERLVQLSHRSGRSLRIVCLGPLTNIATALRLEPSLAETVGGIVIMGGALNVPGNVTEHAEMNIFADPEAAELVLSENWNNSLLVPLDITNQHRLKMVDAELLQASHDSGVAAIGRMMSFYIAAHDEFAGQECILHDPLAAAIGIDTLQLAEVRECGIRVNTSAGPERGRTTATEDDEPYPKHRVAFSTVEDFGPLLLEKLRPRPIHA